MYVVFYMGMTYMYVLCILQWGPIFDRGEMTVLTAILMLAKM